MSPTLSLPLIGRGREGELEARHINKRALFISITIVSVLGIVSLLLYYYLALRAYYAAHQPTSFEKPPTYLYSITGGKEAPFSGPLGVTTAFGQVYVTDSRNSQVKIFTREGRLTRSFFTPRFIKTNYPMYILVDGFRRVYVSVAPENELMVFDQRGKFRYIFPQEFSPQRSQNQEKAPFQPVGLFYGKEKIYLTDVGDHTVKVFNTTGKLVQTIGKPGSGKAEFNYPNGVVADERGTIYVADSNNGRVQVFNAQGKFLYFFTPEKADMPALPRGIAIDKLNRVHVVDTLRHKVFVFTKEGKFLFTYGELGKTDAGFSYPNGIAIDRQTGLIFIADRANNRIAVWGD